MENIYKYLHPLPYDLPTEEYAERATTHDTIGQILAYGGMFLATQDQEVGLAMMLSGGIIAEYARFTWETMMDDKPASRNTYK